MSKTQRLIDWFTNHNTKKHALDVLLISFSCAFVVAMSFIRQTYIFLLILGSGLFVIIHFIPGTRFSCSKNKWINWYKLIFIKVKSRRAFIGKLQKELIVAKNDSLSMKVSLLGEKKEIFNLKKENFKLRLYNDQLLQKLSYLSESAGSVLKDYTQFLTLHDEILNLQLIHSKRIHNKIKVIESMSSINNSSESELEAIKNINFYFLCALSEEIDSLCSTINASDADAIFYREVYNRLRYEDRALFVYSLERKIVLYENVFLKKVIYADVNAEKSFIDLVLDIDKFMLDVVQLEKHPFCCGEVVIKVADQRRKTFNFFLNKISYGALEDNVVGILDIVQLPYD